MVNGITPPIIVGPPIRTSPPAALPLSLAELRTQIRMTDHDPADEDALLMGYLRAATEYCENYTGLSFITQGWSQTFSGFPTVMILRRRPLQAVTSIEYLDGDVVSQPLEPSLYQVSGVGSDKQPATIRLASGQTWPTVYSAANAVTVTYTAGFGDTHNDVPELIRHAITLLVAYWHAQRETVSMESGRASVGAEVPFGTHALLHDWRPLAVA